MYSHSIFAEVQGPVQNCQIVKQAYQAELIKNPAQAHLCFPTECKQRLVYTARVYKLVDGEVTNGRASSSETVGLWFNRVR